MPPLPSHAWRSNHLIAGILLLLACVAPPAAASGRPDPGGLQADGRYSQFIVRYREGSHARIATTALQASLDSVALATSASIDVPLALTHVRRLVTGDDVVRAGRGLDRNEAEALMRAFSDDRSVERIDVDPLLQPDMTPNDPYFSWQWSFNHAVAGIRADRAWDDATGEGVVVAVIDTGITSHEDLDANVLPGYDFIDNPFLSGDGDGRDADPTDMGNAQDANVCGPGTPATNSTWHGTHVAGTIAAVTNNAKGVAGIAHGAKVLPVRVLAMCGGHLSDIVEAIIWASGGDVPGVPVNPHPAEVINLSQGYAGGPCPELYQVAIDAAVRRGTTVVASAGNDGVDGRDQYPGNCRNVIAVTSLTETGEWDRFSNFGATVDLAAPGVSIVSTSNPGQRKPSPLRYHLATYSGTSVAVPHVSGAVALLQSHATKPYTPAQVEAILKATARPFRVAPPHAAGAGMLDAAAALQGVAPVAADLSVSGVPKAGYTVTAQYTYVDPEGDLEGGTAYQWYRHKPGEYLVPIPNALGKTYLVQASDIGEHRLLVKVRPRALTGLKREGSEVEAQTAANITAGAAPVISNLRVDGAPIAGYTVRAKYDYADADGDAESGTRFQWYLHKAGQYLVPIEGAVYSTYTVKAGDIGLHQLLVKVTPRSRTGYPDIGTQVEAQTPIYVIPGSAPVASNPTLVGTALPGRVVTVQYGFVDDDGDKEGNTTFQWYLHQPGNYIHPIAGATGRRYTVKLADVGPHRLLVQITPRSLGGYPDVGKVAQVQTPDNLSAGSAPVVRNLSLDGVARAGQTVTLQYTYFDADGDAEGATSFQWYLHQPGNYITAIPGATDRRYTVKASDVGNHRLLVKVTPRSIAGTANMVGVTGETQTAGNVAP